MNWDAISATGEVFGAIAVVVSVVYLATQVRKQTEEARLTASRDLATQLGDKIEKMIAETKAHDYKSTFSNTRQQTEPGN